MNSGLAAGLAAAPLRTQAWRRRGGVSQSTSPISVSTVDGTSSVAAIIASSTLASNARAIIAECTDGSTHYAFGTRVPGSVIITSYTRADGAASFKSIQTHAGGGIGTTYINIGLSVYPGVTLATNMTTGFINIPGAAGAPSGVPSVTTGFPLYWDSTNLKLCVYSGGAWKTSAAFT